MTAFAWRSYPIIRIPAREWQHLFGVFYRTSINRSLMYVLLWIFERIRHCRQRSRDLADQAACPRRQPAAPDDGGLFAKLLRHVRHAGGEEDRAAAVTEDLFRIKAALGPET